jgi:isopentenyl-diphosphate delta-isomerase
MTSPRVILVDVDDNVIGTEEKMRAHTLGKLHRAVSVFVVMRDGAFVLQQRAVTKYHSGGLWSNAACTHPRTDETTLEAATRCLREEMGSSAALRPAFRFLYRAPVPPELVEHEYDHVFVGTIDGAPEPAADEVQAWRAVPPNELHREVTENPHAFTVWFRIAFPLYQNWSGRADRWTNPFIATT